MKYQDKIRTKSIYILFLVLVIVLIFLWLVGHLYRKDDFDSSATSDLDILSQLNLVICLYISYIYFS